MLTASTFRHYREVKITAMSIMNRRETGRREYREHTHTVNLGVLPQHRNRCKFLQLCGHRFSVYLHSFWC